MRRRKNWPEGVNQLEEMLNLKRAQVAQKRRRSIVYTNLAERFLGLAVEVAVVVVVEVVVRSEVARDRPLICKHRAVSISGPRSS